MENNNTNRWIVLAAALLAVFMVLAYVSLSKRPEAPKQDKGFDIEPDDVQNVELHVLPPSQAGMEEKG